MLNAAQAEYREAIAARFGQREDLKKLFRSCYGSTLETTVQREGEDVFVVTGDIPAMWLRDSSAQMRHYVPVAAEDTQTAALLCGLLRKHWFYIQIDPYANAFNKEPNGRGHQQDRTEQNPWLWERKYEVDSLCYPLQLAWLYWKATGKTDVFDADYLRAVHCILALWKVEQNHEDSPYTFERGNCPTSDTLPCGGKGAPVTHTGMTWSGFRPSDDACRYGYLVPANMFAVAALGHTAEILHTLPGQAALARQAEALRAEIEKGIREHGVYKHPEFGDIYAYETDGRGNYNLMDDANVPSLLSAPYLGYCHADDPLYQNTRRFVLSRHNPYYYSGRVAKGVGSPHTPANRFWHIALAVQGLTSANKNELDRIAQTLLFTHAGTWEMHESVDVNDPALFTRPWFAWANSICAEFLVHYAEHMAL